MGTYFSLDISRATFSAEGFNTAGVLCTINWSDAKMDVWWVEGHELSIWIYDSNWNHEELT